MKLHKIIIGLCIGKIIYNTVKKHVKKYDDKKYDDKKSDVKSDTIINKPENSLVIYKHKKMSNYDLKDVYNNFFNKMKYDMMNNDQINNFYKKNEDQKSNDLITKNNIELYDTNNFIHETFYVEKDMSYKIICSFESINIKSIKLILSNETKRFVYENNIITDIKKYTFILDNNIFTDSENIHLYIFCEPIINDNIKIINFYLDVCNNNQKNYNAFSNPIAIFNINDKYEQLYSNTKNILDFTDYNDESDIFFI
jgi:hypothetical protein